MPGRRHQQVAASVLSADLSQIGEEARRLEAAGLDRIQWDVMDGRFVPNLTFGPDLIAAARPYTGLFFEAHLMVDEPGPLLGRYAEAGCDLTIVHAEACAHLHRTLGRIRDEGMAAGVALNPATPLEAVRHVLDLCDLVLLMTVNPGFGGQRYLASMESKIRETRRYLDEVGSRADLEVDGGIGPSTIQGPAHAGADVFVVGSALFRHPEGPAGCLEDVTEALDGSGPSPAPLRSASPTPRERPEQASAGR